MVSGARRQELGHFFAGLLSPACLRVEGIRWEFRDPADFSGDMWITLSYRIPRFAAPIGGALEFRSPMMQIVLHDGNLFRAGASKWGKDRKTDLFLYYTQLVEGTETIRLPKGYKAIDPPQSDEIDERYAYFKGTSRIDGRNLVIEQRAEVRRRQIPPDGYGGFRAAMEEAREFGDGIYRIQKGGSK
jgi:hypothetical protein